jgi:hypothetical protein
MAAMDTPALQRFKLKHFGHDNVILHERDIRKHQGPFAFLKSKEKKQAFMGELTAIIDAMPFTLICSVIRKEQLRAKYVAPDNPYHIALGFGLERVFFFLSGREAAAGKTHVMVEQRGKREDAELELEFRRVCAGAKLPQGAVAVRGRIRRQEEQLGGIADRRSCGSAGWAE